MTPSPEKYKNALLFPYPERIEPTLNQIWHGNLVSPQILKRLNARHNVSNNEEASPPPPKKACIKEKKLILYRFIQKEATDHPSHTTSGTSARSQEIILQKNESRNPEDLSFDHKKNAVDQGKMKEKKLLGHRKKKEYIKDPNLHHLVNNKEDFPYLQSYYRHRIFSLFRDNLQKLYIDFFNLTQAKNSESTKYKSHLRKIYFSTTDPIKQKIIQNLILIFINELKKPDPKITIHNSFLMNSSLENHWDQMLCKADKERIILGIQNLLLLTHTHFNEFIIKNTKKEHPDLHTLRLDILRSFIDDVHQRQC